MKITAYTIIIMITLILLLIVGIHKSISEINNCLGSIYDLGRVIKPVDEKQQYEFFAYVIKFNLYAIILLSMFIGMFIGTIISGIFTRNHNQTSPPSDDPQSGKER